MKTINKEDENLKLVTIPRGPQFNTYGNSLVGIVSILFLIIAIVLSVNSEFAEGFIFFIISFVLIYYILDFHGFQLDKEKHLIRDYKDFLGFKIGKWENLNDFNSIHLKKSHLTLRYGKGGGTETFHYYHIKLADETRNKEMFLAEYNNYYKAVAIAQNVVNATGLEFKDYVKPH